MLFLLTPVAAGMFLFAPGHFLLRRVPADEPAAG